MDKAQSQIKELLVDFIELLKRRNAKIAAIFSQVSSPEKIDVEIKEIFSWEKEIEWRDFYVHLLTELDLKNYEELEQIFERLKVSEGMVTASKEKAKRL